MKLRHPPGRAGRLWLEHRIRVATRGADLLDKKRRALLHERRRLVVVARETEAEWSRVAREAELWLDRAAVLAGEEKVAMLAAQQPAARVSVEWRSSMGVVFASEARVDLEPHRGGASGGSAATDMALQASRRAVEAAVKDAAARSALARISAELALTARRHRALQRRWLPALGEASRQLSEALDEAERDEATRAVWALRRQRQGGT
jgi:V/A-type H+/Na+-transporting ATPase subunit D